MQGYLAQPNGVQQWNCALKRADNGTDEGTVVRDLLLESLAVTENARQFIGQAWTALEEHEGRLLKLLLGRFLFIATIPDLRIPKLVNDPALAAQAEAAFRIPIWTYWGHILGALVDRVDDICLTAPLEAAQICHTWLQKTPIEIAPDTQFPWRKDAANLAVRIAKEMQARRAESRYVERNQDRIAYEAALLAAHELPDEVEQLALELAKRRPPSDGVQQRKEAARRAADAERKKHFAENPEAAQELRKLGRPVLPMGPLRDQWPDGPARRVTQGFQDAVLNGTAIISLANVRPETAVEVLLAVCIEEPQHENPYGRGLSDDCGLVSWHEGYPAMYFRGPFLQFFRHCPSRGLDFAIRLINFATARWREGEVSRCQDYGDWPEWERETSVVVTIEGKAREWLGDSRVYRWHLDWPVDAKIITCVLMALEKWLYERIEADEDVAESLLEIVNRSESVAFAGVLIDVGKKRLKYFFSELLPLLGTPEVYLWEPKILLERSGMKVGLMGWWNQPQRLVEIAHDWHGLQHRQYELSYVAISLMLQFTEVEQYFESCRTRWKKLAEKNDGPRELEILIERFNPANYELTETDAGTGFKFVMPEKLEERITLDQRAADQEMQLLTFPMQCRQILDGNGEPPPDSQVWFWESVQKLESLKPSDADGQSRAADAVAGGIAVLIRMYRSWLDEERLQWCLARLKDLLDEPPPRREFDLPETLGDMHWDCFAAEAGVCLLHEMPTNPFIREVVAMGTAGYHYGTTQKVMLRAYESRALLKDDFVLLQRLAIQWSAIRRIRMRSEQWAGDAHHRSLPSLDQAESEAKRWSREHIALIDGFVDHSIEPQVIANANATATQELDRLQSIRFPDREEQTRPRRTWYRQKAHRTEIGLDVKVLESAFSWLDPSTTTSSSERQMALDQIVELLNLVLESLVNCEDSDADELDGLPDDFDCWVFGLASRAIVSMRDDEEPSSLWKPILSLSEHAHEWTERFFWYWFTDGVAAAPTEEVFAKRWTEMLRFAIDSPAWALETSQSLNLKDRVYEILGYHFGCDSVAASEEFAYVIAKMKPILREAAQRWFKMPRVANGFAASVIRPGYDQLLCDGVHWLSDAMSASGEDRFWQQHEIDYNLVRVLDHCWTRRHVKVAGDTELQAKFLRLLTSLASRGSPEAMALRDRLLDSIKTA